MILGDNLEGIAALFILVYLMMALSGLFKDL